MGSVRKEGSAISPTKKSGNVSKLSLLQKKIIAGHVLYTNDQGNTVSVDDYVHVAWEFFGVKISPSSVSRYMVETHLSVQLVGKRWRKTGVTVAKYNKLYYDTLISLHNAGVFSNKREDLVCLDYVTTSRRTDVLRTIGGKSRRQVKGAKKKLKYTDTLLTCVGADGYQTPSIMYTHNPQFSEKNWDDGMEELLKFFSIDADRIVYTKATASYHPETKDTTTHFMDHNTHLNGGDQKK